MSEKTISKKTQGEVNELLKSLGIDGYIQQNMQKEEIKDAIEESYSAINQRIEQLLQYTADGSKLRGEEFKRKYIKREIFLEAVETNFKSRIAEYLKTLGMLKESKQALIKLFESAEYYETFKNDIDLILDNIEIAVYKKFMEIVHEGYIPEMNDMPEELSDFLMQVADKITFVTVTDIYELEQDNSEDEDSSDTD